MIDVVFQPDQAAQTSTLYKYAYNETKTGSGKAQVGFFTRVNQTTAKQVTRTPAVAVAVGDPSRFKINVVRFQSVAPRPPRKEALMAPVATADSEKNSHLDSGGVERLPKQTVTLTSEPP